MVLGVEGPKNVVEPTLISPEAPITRARGLTF